MEKGTNLLRARLNTPGIYHVFNLVFAVLVAGILAIVLFFNVYSFGGVRFSWYTKLGVAVCGSLLSLLLFWIFTHAKKPKKGVEIAVVGLLMLALIALQGFLGWQLRVQPGGEAGGFGQVYQLASGFALGQPPPGEYFVNHPYDIAPYTLLCGLFSLLQLAGLNDFLLPSMVLNVAAIAGSVFLLYLVARRLFGPLTAIFVLLAACLTSPFLLYVPMAYTTTLLLPLPVGAVLLWLGARGRWREGLYRGAVLRFCVLSALLALGALFRLSVLVLWLAVAVDLLLLLCGKGRGLMLLAGFGTLAVVLVGGALALLYSPLVPAANYLQDGMPLSRGLLMGLSQTGGYNQADENLLLSVQGRGARGELALQEAQNRLADYGVLGFVQHLGDKLSYSFGDGSYGALSALQQNPVNPGNAVLGVMAGGVMSLLYFAVQAATLFWMLMAAIRSFLRRNEALTFVRLAVFGFVVFLLVWEAQPGYLVCFLPLFLLCAAEAGPRPVAVRLHASLPKAPTVEEEAGEAAAQPAASVPDYMNPDFRWEAPVAAQWQPLTPQGEPVGEAEGPAPEA